MSTFKLEKQMIPILKKYFSIVYNTDFSIEEFKTGMGVADLAFARKLTKSYYPVEKYEYFYYIEKILNSNKSIIKNDFLQSEFGMDEKMIEIIIKLLLRNKSLKCIGSGKYHIVRSFKPAFCELFMVEAKLNDWKEALFQAVRHKAYSHKSFVALPEESIKKINLQDFKKENIGLISVQKNDIFVIVKPKKEKPATPEAFYYLTEIFARQNYLQV